MLNFVLFLIVTSLSAIFRLTNLDLIEFTNVLAIGFLFLIIKKYYNQTLAFIVSILIASSPTAILFSRKIWPPDIVLPFTVVILYSAHKIIVEKKEKFWIPLSAFLLLIVQLDLAYIFFDTRWMI